MEPVYGLVLAGGKSSRMGVDKSLLLINGRTAFTIGYKALKEHCDKVYISCTKRQEKFFSGYSQIHDMHEGCGPLGGLVSAFLTHYGTWIVLACDMPNISHEAVGYLIKHRDN